MDEIIHQKDGLSEIVERIRVAPDKQYRKALCAYGFGTDRKECGCHRLRKKVYLFGVGASGIVCYDINYKLSRIIRM